MKKTIGAFILALVVGALVGVATTADAGPKLRPNSARFHIGQCDGGTANGIVVSPGGTYVMTVLNETTWICVGDAGCDVAGQPLSVGVYEFDFDNNTALSCRGNAWTGDITGTYSVRGNP